MNRTVLAIGAVSVRLRPSEVRRARQRHAAVVAELALDAADRVASRRATPAAAIGVGHENRAVADLSRAPCDLTVAGGR